MTKYDYLRLPKKLSGQISYMTDRIESLKDRARGYKSADNSPAISGTRDPFKSQGFIVSYAGLEDEREKKIEEFNRVSANIQQAIERLSSDDYREILTLRFLQGWDIDTIAQYMGYCEATISKKIRSAMDSLPLTPDF